MAECIYAGDYVIADGDSFQINVWGYPELSLGVSVRHDGKISIPALGEIKVVGYTPLELAEMLEEKMQKVVKTPIVSIIMGGMTNYEILVLGNGVSPGIHTLNKKTTLLKFLTRFGSMENVDLREAYLMRNKRKIKEDFYALFVKADLSKDIVLEPYDILFIPDNFEKQITIVGAVGSPGKIPYREGMTILDVIFNSGGFEQFAKQNDVVIIRKTRDGKEGRTSVRVKDVMEGKLEENIEVMPGDFIIVKESLF
jgi:polysaccharide export outer membrane protein